MNADPNTPRPDDSYMSTRDMVKEIRADVKAMTITAASAAVAAQVTNVNVSDHETRLRVIERTQFRIGGMGSITVIAIGGLAGLGGLALGLAGFIASH